MKNSEIYNWLLVLTIYSGVRASGRWMLSDKNIVVTGGTKGIGKAIVEECCSLGATVLTCARNSEELDECLNIWKNKGYNVKGIVVDVSSALDRLSLLNEASKLFDGKVHVLINNVGTNIRNKAIYYTEDDYKKIMATNLESSFSLCTLFYPLLKVCKNGCVINLGSVAGGNNLSIKSGVIYAMTKAALNQMSYNLACEWAADNIRVNVVAPWYITTPLTEKYLSDESTLQSICARTPMGRVGNVEEVSAAVAFLAMDCASYITGQVLSVDGGFTRYGYF